jgi:hypothetical protein
MLLVFLLLGAVVNVAVAWGCSAFVPLPVRLPPGPTAQPTPHEERWMVDIGWKPTVGEASDVFVSRALRSGSSCLQLSEFVESPDLERSTGYSLVRVFFRAKAAFGVHVAAGWPWPALGGYGLSRPPNNERMNAVTNYVRTTSAIGLPGAFTGQSGRVPRLLPMQPLWPGFALNTLFYAAILWLMFAALTTLRRWRRIKRGLCPACAYPVGASPVCTECGTQVKTSK